MERENEATFDLESVINSISGISSSKVICDEAGNIEEIHVLADQDRGAKQISRDIQSLLITKYNLKVDYKIISVAQIDSGDKAERKDRFSIGAVGYCLIENYIEVKVVLKKEEKEFESIVRGLNSKNNRFRLIAQATLDCVHRYMGSQDIFIVEDIGKAVLAKNDIINIAITFTSSYGEEMLIGSAILKKDEYEAIVRATLDAINRKIVFLEN